MENQMNAGGQNSISQPVQIPEKPKTNYLVIGVVILVCFVLFGFGGYYLGKQSSNSQNANSEEQASPTITSDLNSPINTPTSQQVSALPTGWSYKNNGECGVKFAIPPKEAPYYYPVDVNRQPSVTSVEGSGRFWDFPRGGVYPNLLTKFPNGYDQHKQAVTMFASPDEASGYVSQAVVVSCIPNNGRFANNNAMISSLTKELDTYNKSTKEETMQASSYIIKNTIFATRWGNNVVDFTVAENTTAAAYTMFITPQLVYEVRVLGSTSDIPVKETAKKIFDNLHFSYE